MAMVEVGKNFNDDVFIDGGSGISFITENL
jgi:hypothetical protein